VIGVVQIRGLKTPMIEEGGVCRGFTFCRYPGLMTFMVEEGGDSGGE
jgi:hypothetical protein